MTDPFKITGPAAVSFSGGESSGYMLWRVIQSHGGTLPKDVLVVFCNTGKERPETLDFVERCSREWGAPIVWLEYRHAGKGTRKPGFVVVDHATASRNGEPLEAAITARRGDSGFLPNPVTRYCTIETKIKTLIRYLRSLGWEEWKNVIGFRADEPQRVAKLRRAESERPTREELTASLWDDDEPTPAKTFVKIMAAVALREPREESVTPLHATGVTRADVRAFWAAHPFRLGIDDSNCDNCFLKSRARIERNMRERPESAEWWVRMEAGGGRFRKDRASYAAMLESSKRASLPMMDDEPDELSIACHCTD